MVMTLLLAFLYGVGTAVVLPTPLEAVLAGAKFAPGWAVIIAATLGKFAGAYAIFYLGAYLKRLPRVRDWQARNRYVKKLLEVGTRWVNRFGAPALFLLLLIPGFPDTGAVYLLAVAGGRPLSFALATAAAAAIRLSLAYVGLWSIAVYLDR